MKVNELMLNDWVYSDILKKPWQLRPSDIRRIVLEPDMIFDEDGNFKHIQPIPLTEEMLGYNKHHRVYISAWEFPYAVIDSEDGNTHILVRFKYVHELQHALRLCGLNELADDFKVQENKR